MGILDIPPELTSDIFRILVEEHSLSHPASFQWTRAIPGTGSYLTLRPLPPADTFSTVCQTFRSIVHSDLRLQSLEIGMNITPSSFSLSLKREAYRNIFKDAREVLKERPLLDLGLWIMDISSGDFSAPLYKELVPFLREWNERVRAMHVGIKAETSETWFDFFNSPGDGGLKKLRTLRFDVQDQENIWALRRRQGRSLPLLRHTFYQNVPALHWAKLPWTVIGSIEQTLNYSEIPQVPFRSLRMSNFPACRSSIPWHVLKVLLRRSGHLEGLHLCVPEGFRSSTAQIFRQQESLHLKKLTLEAEYKWVPIIFDTRRRTLSCLATLCDLRIGLTDLHPTRPSNIIDAASYSISLPSLEKLTITAKMNHPSLVAWMISSIVAPKLQVLDVSAHPSIDHQGQSTWPQSSVIPNLRTARIKMGLSLRFLQWLAVGDSMLTDLFLDAPWLSADSASPARILLHNQVTSLQVGNFAYLTARVLGTCASVEELAICLKFTELKSWEAPDESTFLPNLRRLHIWFPPSENIHLAEISRVDQLWEQLGRWLEGRRGTTRQLERLSSSHRIPDKTTKTLENYVEVVESPKLVQPIGTWPEFNQKEKWDICGQDARYIVTSNGIGVYK